MKRRLLTASQDTEKQYCNQTLACRSLWVRILWRAYCDMVDAESRADILKWIEEAPWHFKILCDNAGVDIARLKKRFLEFDPKLASASLLRHAITRIPGDGRKSKFQTNEGREKKTHREDHKRSASSFTMSGKTFRSSLKYDSTARGVHG